MKRIKFWLFVFGLAIAIWMVPFPAIASQPQERVIHIDARRFEYTPSIIKVNPGDHVTIDLVSHDVVHGLSIDGYNLAMTADPGQTAHLTFIADRAGSFRFRCSVTCGNMHPFMIGKLEVGPNILLLRGAALALLSVIAGLWGFKER